MLYGRIIAQNAACFLRHASVANCFQARASDADTGAPYKKNPYRPDGKTTQSVTEWAIPSRMPCLPQLLFLCIRSARCVIRSCSTQRGCLDQTGHGTPHTIVHGLRLTTVGCQLQGFAQAVLLHNLQVVSHLLRLFNCQWRQARFAITATPFGKFTCLPQSFQSFLMFASRVVHHYSFCSTNVKSRKQGGIRQFMTRPRQRESL
jgi:hypothetical protein